MCINFLTFGLWCWHWIRVYCLLWRCLILTLLITWNVTSQLRILPRSKRSQALVKPHKSLIIARYMTSTFRLFCSIYQWTAFYHSSLRIIIRCTVSTLVFMLAELGCIFYGHKVFIPVDIKYKIYKLCLNNPWLPMKINILDYIKY